MDGGLHRKSWTALVAALILRYFRKTALWWGTPEPSSESTWIEFKGLVLGLIGGLSLKLDRIQVQSRNRSKRVI